MNGKASHGKAAPFLRQIETYTFLGLLLLILLLFNRPLAMYVVKKLIIVVVSSQIITNFFYLVVKFEDDNPNRMYGYMVRPLFLLFIIMVIDFQLNERYDYVLYAFICLLVFLGIVFYFISKGGIDGHLQQKTKK